ncbi:MAG: hypothetical protein ACTSVI_03230 [Promethearchaeota archaeon]
MVIIKARVVDSAQLNATSEESIASADHEKIATECYACADDLNKWGFKDGDVVTCKNVENGVSMSFVIKESRYAAAGTVQISRSAWTRNLIPLEKNSFKMEIIKNGSKPETYEDLIKNVRGVLK